MTHRWTFFRAGGFDQVRFTSGADLVALDQLDLKLWAALACPTRGLEFDTRTLDLIDTDKDGRIRAPEVIAAVKWTCALLKDPGEILKGSPSLPLEAINESTPEGQQILKSAKQILANLGKSTEPSISVTDTADTVKIFAATKFNGDGIVPAASADDPATAAVINDIIASLGAETDRSGQPGISQAKADQFFTSCQAFADWSSQADKDPEILPLGAATAQAFASYSEVKAKVDDYFARCRLAAFDPRSVTALNRQEAEYLAVSAANFSASATEVAGFPLTRIEAGRALSLKDGLNPAWVDAMCKFQADVVKPLLGEKASLTEADWAAISRKFDRYVGWTSTKCDPSIEKLGVTRVREILSNHSRESITQLLARDKALENEASSIAGVDKLVRYCRDLKVLLTNFVSFEDFYSPERKATFQWGTLFLDGRSCDLCVMVHDVAKHASLAGLAKTYLAYCDCTRPGGEKLTIAAGFTGGDSDFLLVGRNGVFFDRKGRDWDATITKIVENPISIRQAFWSPYKKLVRLIEEQVAKRAAAADADADKRISALSVAAANVDKTKPEQKKVDVGTVAALGVAFGAIGGAFVTLAGYLAGVLKLPFWQVCLAFVGVLLLISGPAMLIAILKLRQRNLGPILDANGWAINGRVRMNVPFGGSLTCVARLPEGSRAVATDVFAERPPTWPKLVLIVVVVCFVVSLVNNFEVPPRIKSWVNKILGRSPLTLSTNAATSINIVTTNVITTNLPAAPK